MKSAIIRALLAGYALAAGSAAIRAATPVPPPNAAPFGEESRVSGADLATIAGRADTAMSIRAENSSTVSHNSVIGDSTTGGISFDTQAMQNLSGLSLLSANTGNNVSINSSLNLNVSIRP